MTALTSIDLSVYSDLYKSVYGSRPVGLSVPQSPEQYDEEFAFLQDRLEENMAEEEAQEQRALDDLEARRSRIQELCPLSDEADVMRYIRDAEGCSDDWEELDWRLGVRFGTCKALAEG